MLYDEPGPLLARAGELLASGATDEQVLSQLRPIGVQLKRLGAMWPDLFMTLARENAVLVSARDEIAASLDAHLPEAAAGLTAADDPDDPVMVYRHVLRQLNDVLPVLHEHRRTPWGASALAALRLAITEAGRVQAMMVDKAWLA
jgi:hypothetical protein